MRRVLLLVLTLTAILAAGGEAQAATCSFTGVGGVGVWHQGSNWSCGHIPTAATSDIAIVDIGDNVTVDQDDSVPTLTQNAGTITFSGSSTLQATTATTLNAGTITGQGTLRAASGTFSKAISGWLTVQNLAKLVLDANASITAGNICLIDNGGGDPQLQINATLTIGAGADADVFNCSTGLDGPAIKIGAAGSLVKSAAGTTTSYTGIDVAGQLSVASGQTLNLSGGFTQTAGTIAVASGGSLGGGAASAVSGGTFQVNGSYAGNPTLTGTGVLTGTGTVTGTVTNTSGTVRPGSSPGMLTISGPFTQGAGGTLEIEIAGTTPGTQFDVLAVSSHATLDGTVAVQGSLDPQLTDTFQFLTSGSRSGTLATVTSAPLPGGKSYSLYYPPGSPFGARLVLQPPQPPQNTDPPSVTGTSAAGETVTCEPGTWTNGPSFAFQWLRDGQPIGGAIGATYALTDTDAGHQIACRVTATNSASATQATSAAVAVPALPPADVPPANTVPPTVNGNNRISATLTCATGTWTGAPPPALTIAWLHDGKPISGATAAAYVLTDADGGRAVACRVTATNTAGSAAATSAAMTVARPAEQILATQTKDQVATALGLLSAKACVSRRSFTIRVNKPAGVTIKALKVVVNGKAVKTKKVAGRFTATVDLRGLPKGRFTVAVTITTPNGLKITGLRRYRTCALKRR